MNTTVVGLVMFAVFGALGILGLRHSSAIADFLQANQNPKLDRWSPERMHDQVRFLAVATLILSGGALLIAVIP